MASGNMGKNEYYSSEALQGSGGSLDMKVKPFCCWYYKKVLDLHLVHTEEANY